MILFESIALDVISLFLVISITLYYYFTRNFDFWKKRGVSYVKPLPFVGSLKDVALQKSSIGYQLKTFYDEYKGDPYVGIYSFDQPAVMVRDLDLVKKVLVKDAQSFQDRMSETDEDLDPLGSNSLILMKGEKWRFMRHNISPTFTSGKMKHMFYLVENCAKELENYLDTSIAGGSPVDVKEATAKFTTDVIASCAFGIDSNTLKNPNAEFRHQLRKVFIVTPMRSLALFLSFFAPKLVKALRIQTLDPSIATFVRNTMWDTVKYREQHGITRHDFLDTLIHLRKKNGEQKCVEKDEKPIFDFKDDEYVAQAFTFLTAGFETSSSTMSFALYQLAIQPELQQRLRNEITDILQKHNNQVTYEAIQEMKYLEMVVNETLRLYPILPFLERKCLQDYDFPSPSSKGTVTIPAGIGVYIPVLAIQHDPEYYPEPEKFDPERFGEENKRNRPAYTYMPFGEGPRNCIGMRFGLMQTKTGLIHILSRYEVAPCKDTPFPLVMDKKGFLLSTIGDLPLTFKSIKA